MFYVALASNETLFLTGAIGRIPVTLTGAGMALHGIGCCMVELCYSLAPCRSVQIDFSLRPSRALKCLSFDLFRY